MLTIPTTFFDHIRFKHNFLRNRSKSIVDIISNFKSFKRYTINIMFSKTVAILALAAGASAERVRVISQESDLKFFPSSANFPTSVNDGGEPTEGEIIGNRFIQNGALFPEGLVDITDGKLSSNPLPDDFEFYTSLCVATDGVNFSFGPPSVLENICQYNICTSFGCVFARSGGPFDLDPIDQSPSAVPDIRAAIVGGTRGYVGATGTIGIRTLSVPADNRFGESVLELEVPFGLWIGAPASK
jgi:hypothetical protein